MRNDANFDQKVKMCGIEKESKSTKTVEEAKKAKTHPPPPRNVNVRDVITQKARESGIVPSDSKKTGSRQKKAK